jgi:hypothetical protein
MKPEDIAFVVPSKDGQHVLYLKDGRLVTISTYDGAPYHVGRLPSFEQIHELETRGRHATPG